MSRSAADPTVVRVYLGLGTNLGDRSKNLRRALQALANIVELRAVSGVYESDAVGYLDQPRFWNLAVAADTSLPPERLLDAVKNLERELGRTTTFAMGPRLIDIDLLMHGVARVDSPTLQVPHPRLLERPFVLRPLLDLDPDLVHPVTGERLSDRLRNAGADTLLTTVADVGAYMPRTD